jgi:hypothetical protein
MIGKSAFGMERGAWMIPSVCNLLTIACSSSEAATYSRGITDHLDELHVYKGIFSLELH